MENITPKMSAESFAYWLNGFFENIKDEQSLSPSQTQAIISHLKLVFEDVADFEPTDSFKKPVVEDYKNNSFPRSAPIYPQPKDFPMPTPIWRNNTSDKPVC